MSLTNINIALKYLCQSGIHQVGLLQHFVGGRKSMGKCPKEKKMHFPQNFSLCKRVQAYPLLTMFAVGYAIILLFMLLTAAFGSRMGLIVVFVAVVFIGGTSSSIPLRFSLFAWGGLLVLISAISSLMTS